MTNRRRFLQASGAAVLAGAIPVNAGAAELLPTRLIPGTDEALAIIGLGNSAAFRSGDRATAGRLLEIFTSHGGHYVDVGGPSAEFVGRLGREMAATQQLFLGNYVDPAETAAIRRRAVALADAQGKDALDLVHTRDLAGYRSQHGAYRGLKDDGLVRYIGIARTGADGFETIARHIEGGLVDFVQVNYSMLEPEAGERLLPLARDAGIGVAISRPFINGRYFEIVRGHELPAWASEFDCNSWAQFSLKFILAHPAVNCVLTETANPRHALDNLGAGYGRLPDEAMRRRMQAHLLSLARSG